MNYLRTLLGKTNRENRKKKPRKRIALFVESLETREVPASRLALDFGPISAPVKPGFTGASNPVYQPLRAYGFTGSSQMNVVDRGPSDALTRDFVAAHDQFFAADLSNGWYQVTTYFGDPAAPRNGVLIFSERRLVAIAPPTATGQVTVQQFTVQLTDGRLNMAFISLGEAKARFALDGLIIAPLTVTANAGANLTINEGQLAQFNGQASGVPTLSYQWNFGDGSSASGTLQPSKTYLDQGTYTVTLTVTDGVGQKTQDTAVVTVKNVAPTATFSNGGPVGQGGTGSVSFTNPYDPSATDVAAGFRYSYDFNNDGTFEIVDSSSASATVPASYLNSAGTKVVAGRIKDKDGGFTNYTTSITVFANNPPTATFSNGGAVNEGSTGTVSFTNASGGSGAYKYSFDFNNDGAFEVTDSTNASATVPAFYLADGPANRTVRGRINDQAGAYNAYTTTITINNVPPSVTLAANFAETTGTAIVFAASVSDASSVDTAAGFSYLWNFGDGSTSTDIRPSHTYATIGAYTLTLTVKDKDNASTTKTAQVAIAQPAPVGEFIITPYDKIPNFGANPTIVSALSGNWSSPATWSLGRVPVAGDIVSILNGTTVTFDVVSDAALKTVAIQAAGHLVFRTDVNTRLTVINFLVMAGGELQIGTVTNPVAANVKAEILFPDVPLDLQNDPEQYGNGLIGLGTVTIHGAVKNQTFGRLAAEPLAGDTTLILSQPVSGWQAGDRLLLPDTRQLNYNEHGANFVPQWEELNLTSVSADGRVLTLSQPLRFNHKGARNGDGVLEFLPHVANLSRNVLIHSQNPSGTRGHVLMTYRAQVDIRYAQLENTGRTTIDPLDNTTFNPDGTVQHVGENETWRYMGLHMHHLIGPASPNPTGSQYTLIGNTVDDTLDTTKIKWGIAIHDSHYGLIKDNIVYNVAGAGIATEDGNESYNVLDHNFVMRITGTGERADARGDGEIGFEGSGFWFRGPNNYVRDNVATDATFYGYTIYIRNVFNSRVPKFQGADPSVDGQYVVTDMIATPLRGFAGNEIYGATPSGLTIWWLGTFSDSPRDNVGQSVIQGFRVWHIWQQGLFMYQSNNLTFDGLVIRGDNQIMATGNGPTGVDFADYYTKDLTITNSDIQGMRWGIIPSTYSAGTQLIENTRLRNYSNIYIMTLWTSGYRSDYLPSRRIVIRNVVFDVPNVPPGVYPDAQAAIAMAYSTDPIRNLTQSDKVFVYDYNQVAGDNFQVYYTQQRADFIIPQTLLNADGSPKLSGAPVSGLTNQQAWDLYRLAIAGAVAPPTAITRQGIQGLVNPL